MAEENQKTPILAGVVGHPVSHSLSPLIHTVWAKRAEINGYYIPVAVPPTYDEFTRAIDGLRNVGFAGVNVTIPHKEHALRYADTASEGATKAGAANMLTFSVDGVAAENSDITGFASAVRDQTSAPGKTALVLGAGGAARGVVLALQSLGVEDVLICNRTTEKAQTLADGFGLSVLDWAKRREPIESVDIFVNTTSLGMTGQSPLEIDLTGLNPAALVADIVYAPLKTKLLQEAEQRGNKTVDGLAMLMHQAVSGFRQWFGGDALVDNNLRTELIKELSRRGTS